MLRDVFRGGTPDFMPLMQHYIGTHATSSRGGSIYTHTHANASSIALESAGKAPQQSFFRKSIGFHTL
jgi:hypothetical protein